ncbi:MAG: zf-TFIIB domain-containing protein [Lautropia sp.]|nr:zf-TFIIB domain-containing protein [Lautropia sp.]
MGNTAWEGPRTRPASSAWGSNATQTLPCPSCRHPMQRLALESHAGDPVDIDLCFDCHGIWFDRQENLQLSPNGVLTLFERLHAHRDEPHAALKTGKLCPRCRRGLLRGMDRTISGSYVVHRCPQQHGRFSTFASFMVEKGFVRHLTPAEIRSLADKVRTIHCGNCGASVDLRKDHACPYCRSAFSLLDPKAVEAALKRYQRGSLLQGRGNGVDMAVSSAGVGGTGVGQGMHDRHSDERPHAPDGPDTGLNSAGSSNRMAQSDAWTLTPMDVDESGKPTGRRSRHAETAEMREAVLQAKADQILALAEIERLRERHARERQVEQWRYGYGSHSLFGDELWSAGLSLLWGLIRNLWQR